MNHYHLRFTAHARSDPAWMPYCTETRIVEAPTAEDALTVLRVNLTAEGYEEVSIREIRCLPAQVEEILR